MVVWTVNTAVDTVIGQIQRCEHDDTVAVEVLFDLFRQAADFFGDFFVFAGQQHRGFSVADAFAQGSLIQDLPDQFLIVFVFVGVSQGVHDFVMADEFFCFQ